MSRHHNLWNRSLGATGLVLLTMLASGCDEVDCINGDKPQFDVDVLANPVLNQVYTQNIRASIRNRTDDDDFRYSFILEGGLPQGLSTYSSGRVFSFGGTPTELGTYPLQLTVILGNQGSGLDDPDVGSLCSKTDTANYTLTIQER